MELSSSPADYVLLSMAALAAVTVAYETFWRPGLVPKAFRLGHWVYIFTIAYGVPWLIFGLISYVAGDVKLGATIWVVGTIVWSAGWAYQWALRTK